MGVIRHIQEHWLLYSTLAFMLIQLLNMLTKHFSNYAGLKKGSLLIIELLSFLTSKDVKDRIFKLPITSKSPKKEGQ